MARLEEILTEAIGKLQVIYGIILDWQSIDALLPLNEALPKQTRQPIPLTTGLSQSFLALGL